MTILETQNISYSYSVGTPFEVTALKDMSISIKKGSINAIIGHTGSGKSTLIQHLNALLSPQKGKVLFDGKDINESKATAYSAKFNVGLCFQYPEYQLFESTVYKDISFGPANMKLDENEIDRRVRLSLEYVGLKPDILDKSPFELSGGQKRRVAIAGVMAMEPEVLVLDEPTAGLDPHGKKSIISMITNYCQLTGKTVILVSHSMDDVANIADKVIVVNKGRLAMCGTVDEVFSRSEEITAIGLGVPEVTRIIDMLRARGVDLPKGIFTLDEAVAVLLKYLGVSE